MKITFLGTGTSQGVPMIGCNCRVCMSTEDHDKRLRSSIMISHNGRNVVIDTGPDFRQQMLRLKVKELHAVVFTHEHKDHVGGLDDVRAFNYLMGKPMNIFATKEVQLAIKRDFYYAFEKEKYPGVPRLVLHTIDKADFETGGMIFTPIQVYHHTMPVKAFRVGDFTYITDANSIPKAELDKIRGSKIVVINGLKREPHISHFSLSQAIAVLEELKPEKGYITHISHQMGCHSEIGNWLPDFVKPAYDGLILSL